MSNNAYPNPFGWNENEQKEFVSYYTQRQASYKESAQETYTGNAHEAFYDNAEAYTPQLAEIDGYKSAKEISETDETTEVDEPTVEEDKKEESELQAN